jgi:hypothetical protein
MDSIRIVAIRNVATNNVKVFSATTEEQQWVLFVLLLSAM